MNDVYIRPIESEDDVFIAKIIRDNLKSYNLDIPGTAYFDPELDHLSNYYNESDKRAYFVLIDKTTNAVIGGVGFGEFSSWAEMQKLYLQDSAKGKGYGKFLVQEIENITKEAGFTYMYLETHSSLHSAICLYEKLGYKKIQRPECVKHSTMDYFYLKKLN